MTLGLSVRILIRRDKIRPVRLDPSGHIHKHVPPPQYRVTAPRRCDSMFWPSYKVVLVLCGLFLFASFVIVVWISLSRR